MRLQEIMRTGVDACGTAENLSSAAENKQKQKAAYEGKGQNENEQMHQMPYNRTETAQGAVRAASS